MNRNRKGIGNEEREREGVVRDDDDKEERTMKMEDPSRKFISCLQCNSSHDSSLLVLLLQEMKRFSNLILCYSFSLDMNHLKVFLMKSLRHTITFGIPGKKQTQEVNLRVINFVLIPISLFLERQTETLLS
jgi:hypothetical protein